MKNSFRLLIFILVALGLVSCGIVRQETARTQSTFKQNFSIGPMIAAHQELLIEGARALSGMEAGPTEPFVQSHEYMTLQVDTNNTAALIEAVQSDVEEAIRNSGATIVGSGGMDSWADPIAYFSYDYSEGPFYGVINVWGLRGEGTTFVIISQITESKMQNE